MPDNYCVTKTRNSENKTLIFNIIIGIRRFFIIINAIWQPFTP